MLQAIQDYFVSECINLIAKENYEKIALQFPDDLLDISVSIASMIKKETGKQVFILADTSYGSCCVDEVAAEHVNADLIIHYGQSCGSKNSRIPTVQVFKRVHTDLDKLEEAVQFLILNSQRLVILFDNGHQWYDSILYEKFKSNENVYVCYVENSIDHINSKNSEKANDRYFSHERIFNSDINLETNTVLYVGNDSLNQTNLILSLKYSKFYNFSESQLVDVAHKSDSIIRKRLKGTRLHLIEKCKRSRTIGILVGTLGVVNYAQVIEKLKRVISQADCKFYVFVVGKINVPKLANFLEIDLFVLVACSQNSLIDSKEFFKPIITPRELLLALDVEEFKNSFCLSLSFEDFLLAEEPIESDHEIDAFVELTEELSSQLILGNSAKGMIKYDSEAAAFYHNRSFKGLDLELHKEHDMEIQKGRKGIAKGYHGETDL